MLIHDVALSGLHVVFAVDRAGLVPGDGETHQGLFDVAYLRTVPGMTILCPANFAELRDMLRYAVEKLDGPVAVRFPRGGEGAYKDGGAENVKCVRKGTDVTIVTYGINVNTAIDAANTLEKEDISVEIIKLGRISPIDIEEIEHSIGKTGRLLVLEECVGRGSVGESLAAMFACNKKCPETVILLNTGETIAPCGDIEELRKLCGIDAESVCKAIRDELRDSGFGIWNPESSIPVIDPIISRQMQ